LLPGGAVLIAGGGDELSTNELTIFDPATLSYRQVGALQAPRTHHSAIVLRDGRVLILGGEGDRGEVLPTAEIFGAPIRHRAIGR